MSRFLSQKTKKLIAYTPGEQPRDQQYIKLNTNEYPYGPSLYVTQAIARFNASDLRLYPDPDVLALREAASRNYGLPPDWIFAAGGSDEALAYVFMAFFDQGDKVLFPDITYGFYKVYADLFGLEAVEIPLGNDFSVSISDYFSAPGHIFLANPNAPTGIALTAGEIEEVLIKNPERLLILDEAYVDFLPGGSCVGLTKKYDNLIVVQTFSKSRALAGMRLGFAFGQPELIAGLERIKYSFNPYNLDRLSIAVGIAALNDREYLETATKRIIATRERVAAELKAMGFVVLPSSANFLFIRHPSAEGEDLYLSLKEKGILIRHFKKPRIGDYLRVTIGTDNDMNTFIDVLKKLIS